MKVLFISPGGGDIDPKLYGEQNTDSNTYRPDIDKREFRLIQKLLNERVPLIGICRGHQMIAAAIGAKLIQDIDKAGYIEHEFHHKISVLEESVVATILEGDRQVNSLHHQAVVRDSIPTDWKVSAISNDGIVEAIEHEDYPVISVQWHPEMLHGQLSDMYHFVFQTYMNPEEGEQLYDIVQPKWG